MRILLPAVNDSFIKLDRCLSTVPELLFTFTNTFLGDMDNGSTNIVWLICVLVTIFLLLMAVWVAWHPVSEKNIMQTQNNIGLRCFIFN